MKSTKLKDVTKEFLAKATPGKGSIKYEEGFNFKYGQNEKLTALWLLETFGGHIILLKQYGGYMIKNPDYKWNGKFWELKEIQTSSSLDHAIRKAVKQIKEIPGGIIIDISNYKEKKKSIPGIIENRMNIFNIYHGIIIIKNNRSVVSIYKY